MTRRVLGDTLLNSELLALQLLSHQSPCVRKYNGLLELESQMNWLYFFSLLLQLQTYSIYRRLFKKY